VQLAEYLPWRIRAAIVREYAAGHASFSRDLDDAGLQLKDVS